MGSPPSILFLSDNNRNDSNFHEIMEAPSPLLYISGLSKIDRLSVMSRENLIASCELGLKCHVPDMLSLETGSNYVTQASL